MTTNLKPIRFSLLVMLVSNDVDLCTSADNYLDGYIQALLLNGLITQSTETRLLYLKDSIHWRLRIVSFRGTNLGDLK